MKETELTKPKLKREHFKGNSWCKGPEFTVHGTRGRNSKVISVAEGEQVRGTGANRGSQRQRAGQFPEGLPGYCTDFDFYSE